eukprot:TRINITY_DN24216_c0_g1_i1.p1 TRINITY_DN24216_c0_g1~~TRINITY_DN24216_c0_g1_i1.p1  ORF type:complete len:162 (+),score=7.31 TRINITY_DN24216_c0_g1_i1:245-730(+)
MYSRMSRPLKQTYRLVSMQQEVPRRVYDSAWMNYSTHTIQYNTRLDLLKRWSRGEAREVAALAKISVDRALESARSRHVETMERVEGLSKHAIRTMEDKIHAAEYSSRPTPSQAHQASASLRRSASSLVHPPRDSYTPAPPNNIHSALEPFRQFLADRMTT